MKIQIFTCKLCNEEIEYDNCIFYSSIVSEWHLSMKHTSILEKTMNDRGLGHLPPLNQHILS